MRFMLLMIPKGYEKADVDAVPTAEAVEAMMNYNESMRQAGILVALDGLHPQRAGARVEFTGDGKHIVTDGPFIETREALGGYWIVNVKSKADAVEWATRCPGRDCTIEIRQIFEMSEFPEDVRQAAAKFPELQRETGARKETR